MKNIEGDISDKIWLNYYRDILDIYNSTYTDLMGGDRDIFDGMSKVSYSLEPISWTIQQNKKLFKNVADE